MVLWVSEENQSINQSMTTLYSSSLSAQAQDILEKMEKKKTEKLHKQYLYVSIKNYKSIQ